MPKQVLGTLIDQIYQAFEPLAVEPGKRPRFKRQRIYASDILSKLKASRIPVQRARHFLGITVAVIAGRHVWLPPSVELNKALTAAFPQKNQDPERRKAWRLNYNRKQAMDLAIYLIGVMEDNNFRMKAEDLMIRMKEETGRSYNWGTQSLALKQAGIVKKDDYLLMAVPQGGPVEKWLDERLKVPRSVPEPELLKKCPWHPDVVSLYRNGHGYGTLKVEDVRHWYSFSFWSPHEVEL